MRIGDVIYDNDTVLNDSILIVCTCLEYPEKYKMEVINIKNK